MTWCSFDPKLRVYMTWCSFDPKLRVYDMVFI